MTGTCCTPSSLLLAAGLLLVTACGGSSDPNELLDSASRSLQAGDHEAALAGFQAVIDHAEADSSAKFRASRDRVVCEAHVNGDDGAKRAFDQLHGQYEGDLTLDALAKIGYDVASAGCIDAATHVLTVANKLTGEDPTKKAKLKTLSDAIAASGDAEALAKLEGLGYLGD